jgi:hypothetical protein
MTSVKLHTVNSNETSLRKYQLEQKVTAKGYEHTTMTTASLNNISMKRIEHGSKDLSLRAIARLQRNLPSRSQEPRTTSVLMDPGADINLIRGELLNSTKKNSALKVHATAEQNIELTNNGKVIGHIHKAVYLSSVMDTVPGVATQTYTTNGSTYSTTSTKSYCWVQNFAKRRCSLLCGGLCKEQ